MWLKNIGIIPFNIRNKKAGLTMIPIINFVLELLVNPPSQETENKMGIYWKDTMRNELYKYWKGKRKMPLLSENSKYEHFHSFIVC
jgi:hypothetical protein